MDGTLPPISAKRFSGRTKEGQPNKLKTCYDIQLKFRMAEGRRSQVHLLDDRMLEILVQPKLYAGDLLDMVSSHFNLKEKEYFGLAYQDETGHFYWLQMDRRVLEHEFPKKLSQGSAPLTLFFMVKYFVEHITQLRDSSTVEAFYLQAKSLVAKGTIEVESEIAFKLAALVLQATHGDFTDETSAKLHLKKLPVLPTSVFTEHPSLKICEDRVTFHYKELIGQSRGTSIVNYMSLIETLPTYGIHYYQVKDKGGIPWYLGLNHKGLSQYDYSDRKVPRKVFLWKQLENLYFRDRKFSIEVHDAKRVVHTLSSFNLYEDAIEEPLSNTDELSDAICDPTTQVSVSRRTFGPGNVTVYVWLAITPNLTKCIWSMAIAQHQFYLDRKHNKKSQVFVTRNLGQIAAELSRSSQSLSSYNSTPNLSRSASTHSLPTLKIDGAIVSDQSREARAAMLAALKAKRDALQELLAKKEADLKALSLKERELTGDFPAESQLAQGQVPTPVRRHVGTSFTLNDKLILSGLSAEEEVLSKLELNFDIQTKIASAAWKLANDVTAKKNVRRQRKVNYQQAQVKLKEIEKELIIKRKQAEVRKRKAALKAASDGERSEDSVSRSTDGSNISQAGNDAHSLQALHVGIEDANNQINRVITVSTSQQRGSNCPSPVPSSNSSSIPESRLSRQGSISAPPSPTKHRHTPISLSSTGTPPASPISRLGSSRSSGRQLEGQGYKPSSVYQTRQNYRTQNYPTLPLVNGSAASRKYSTESEYDNVSIGSGSGIMKLPYQNRFESSLNTEGSNLYSVSTQRTSQALDSKDDIVLSSPTNRNEQEFGLMSRHNSLDSMRRHSFQRSNVIGQSPSPSPSLQTPPHSPAAINKPITISTSFDERLVRYPSKQSSSRPVEAINNNLHTRLRRHQSYSQHQQMMFQWQQQQAVNHNVHSYQHSLQRQAQARARSDSRSLDFIDCDPVGEYPVFEDYPQHRKDNLTELDCVDGHQFLPPHPHKTRPQASRMSELNLKEMRESKTRLTSQHVQSLNRPSTLPLLPKQAHNLQRHSSVTSILCTNSKPVSVVHPNQQWIETSLDEPVLSPKLKKKNWTETSLDSPLPMRRNRPKEMTASSSTLTSIVSNCNLIPTPSPTSIMEELNNEMCFNSNVIRSQSPLVLQALQVVNQAIAMSPDNLDNPALSGRTSVTPEFYNKTGVEVDVVSVGHFQPYWEETKPYELSDFYKYSTKHRASKSSDSSSSLQSLVTSPKRPQTGGANKDWSPASMTSPNYQRTLSSPAKGGGLLPNSPVASQLKSPNMVMSPDGSFTFEGARSSVADAFHEEMIAWYEDQENVKRATLV